MNSVEENREDDLWDEIGDDENERDEMEDDESISGIAAFWKSTA